MHTGASINPPGGLVRLDGIDALRALAIFFVLMNHVNMRLLLAKVPYTAGLPEQLVSSLVWSGQHGVQIFFAVSGFLITSTALRRWESLSRVSLRGFYLMRFARIAPLLLVLLAVLSVCHFVQMHNFVVSPKTGGLGRALLAALTFHVNVLEARRGYLPGNWDILWSLSVEEMFYLFFPILARLFGRGKWFVTILAGFVILGPFARAVLAQGNEIWKEYSYLGGMDAIAMGCLTALLVSRVRFSQLILRVACLSGAALLVFILCFSLQAESLGLERSGLDMSILAAGTCLVLAAATQTQWRSPRVLGPFLNLGRRSYEIYLTHMFVVFAGFHLFVLAGMPMRAVVPLFLCAIVIAVLCGELVARYFSEPMNLLIRARWGKKLDTAAN
ncbi:MAG TPA: acyltransferase [Candidatus Limnocylindrales bacterium]|nr:acyltransferase [Candidatus Limnocylindrales bacterium]